MIKKLFSLLLAAVFFVQTAGIAAAAEPDTMQAKLEVVEKTAYGGIQTGALLDRVSKLEKDFSTPQPKQSVMQRVDSLYDLVFSNETSPSLVTQMNAIEWGITRSISMKSIQQRVTDMEMTMAGKPSEGTYRERIDQLAEYAFGSKDIPLVSTSVPANTLMKISTVTPINAKNLKVGDEIKYQAAEDVIENGVLLIAKGAPGVGTVTKVVQARNFGRDAEVNIDFNTMRAIDGTDIETMLGEESKKKMESMAMAAGASVAGMVLLGPIGIIGGAFVHGKNIDLPEGTELYIQTKNDVTLYGLTVEQ